MVNDAYASNGCNDPQAFDALAQESLFPLSNHQFAHTSNLMQLHLVRMGDAPLSQQSVFFYINVQGNLTVLKFGDLGVYLTIITYY